MSDAAPDPSPESTLRPGASGIAVTLGDGRAWTLARPGLDPSFDDVRDSLFDAAAAYGEYEQDDVDLARAAAARLLMGAHDLPIRLAFALVAHAETSAVLRAVEAALFGGSIDSYSSWARVAIRAAGVDPLALDPSEVGPLLAELERQKRVPPRDLIPSVRAGARRRQRAAMVANRGVAPA